VSTTVASTTHPCTGLTPTRLPTCNKTYTSIYSDGLAGGGGDGGGGGGDGGGGVVLGESRDIQSLAARHGRRVCGAHVTGRRDERADDTSAADLLDENRENTKRACKRTTGRECVCVCVCVCNKDDGDVSRTKRSRQLRTVGRRNTVALDRYDGEYHSPRTRFIKRRVHAALVRGPKLCA